MKSLEMMKNMMVSLHRYKFGVKSWGFEYWFENNDKYCGKIIQVRLNEWSSHGAFHFHKIKDETFLVLDGTLILDILDIGNIDKNRISNDLQIFRINPNIEEYPRVRRLYLKPFNYVRLYPGVLHRFSSITTEALFTETSTTHREEDSYRIVKPNAEEQLEEFPIDHCHGLVNIPKNTSGYSFITGD